MSCAFRKILLRNSNVKLKQNGLNMAQLWEVLSNAVKIGYLKNTYYCTDSCTDITVIKF